MHARIQIYWCRSSIYRHLKLELLTQFPASNDEKYIRRRDVSRVLNGLMLGQRRRLGQNIKPPLIQRSVLLMFVQRHYFNPWNSEIFLKTKWVSSSCFIWIPMLWIYGHFKYLILLVRGSDLNLRICFHRRQFPTSTGRSRTESNLFIWLPHAKLHYSNTWNVQPSILYNKRQRAPGSGSNGLENFNLWVFCWT